MRQIINGNDLQRLLDENPKSGFFCFTEDRMHDIRLKDNIPQRWANRITKERKTENSLLVWETVAGILRKVVSYSGKPVTSSRTSVGSGKAGHV